MKYISDKQSFFIYICCCGTNKTWRYRHTGQQKVNNLPALEQIKVGVIDTLDDKKCLKMDVVNLTLWMKWTTVSE